MPEMHPDNSYVIVTAFQDRHARTHNHMRESESWTDGSVICALLAIRIVEGLVFNGGLPCVYYNRCGWAVPIAKAGYTLIGAIQHSTLAERAMEVVARAEQSAPDVRHDTEEWLSDRLMELAGEDLEKLDNAWFEAANHEDTVALTARFIIDHQLLDENKR